MELICALRLMNYQPHVERINRSLGCFSYEWYVAVWNSFDAAESIPSKTVIATKGS